MCAPGRGNERDNFGLTHFFHRSLTARFHRLHSSPYHTLGRGEDGGRLPGLGINSCRFNHQGQQIPIFKLSDHGGETRCGTLLTFSSPKLAAHFLCAARDNARLHSSYAARVLTLRAYASLFFLLGDIRSSTCIYPYHAASPSLTGHVS